MTKTIRTKSQDIRGYILRNVSKEGLAGRVTEKFGITRQAANRHLRSLIAEGAILGTGQTQKRTYRLAATTSKVFGYAITSDLAEDIVWTNDIRPLLEALPDNVVAIWQWAFTEMFNNAIDHSTGTQIVVRVERTALYTEIMVSDNGVGIFRKIQQEFGLSDERQALFELSKGKLTTDSRNHSGQGIFFTSRMVNAFDILSGGVYFTHAIEREHDWMVENTGDSQGTAVFMKVDNHTARTTRKTLAEFSVGDSYGFDKTIVPVKLAKYGSDQLISRSQAKRVLARVDQFSQVIFDFSGVTEIGQAFADQIFRVFALEHPNMKLVPLNANKTISGMILAAIKAGRPGYKGSVEKL